MTKGSFLIEFLLWVCFIVPGLIYSIWRLGTRHKGCPSCGGPMIPVDSPVARAAMRARAGMALALGVLCLCTAASFSSPVTEKWFIGERDRIWWPLRKETPLQTLQKTAALLRTLMKPGDLLLTQDPYLAVEAGMRLPAGLELGPFSYFPDWSRERVAACHVLNRERFGELLRTCEAPVAAFSGYGLAIAAPAIQELPAAEQAELRALVLERYGAFRTVERFGQVGTALVISLKK
jgi:hypothetical protein